MLLDSELLKEYKMFQTNFVEETKTHFVFHKVYLTSCRLWDTVEIIVERTGENMAHVHYMLGNQGYTHIQSMKYL
jgi:hypothetical protein